MKINSNKLIVHFIAAVHLLVIFTNAVSIPLLIYFQPIYISLPIITLLASPVIGGTYCIFNNLENIFRKRAGMPEIYDRFQFFLTGETTRENQEDK